MARSLPSDLTIHERVGEGGIADVFRGAWRGREVAVKVLREPDRPGLRKRFVREGRLLQRFAHPGLVRCLAVLDGEQPMLVLELLHGASLDVRLREGPLPPDEAVRVAAAALRALGYLHDNGIVHRDIKASNVWMGDDGRVVLVDLGLAADTSDPLTTTLGDILGTHAYMAPEQIAGAECDHRCDLYSLGVTLYEALCGARPYDAVGLAGYLQAHRAAGATPIVERVPAVPVRLASLVDRLMARDPAARPASAAVALALLTGSSGVRRALEAPKMIGREAVTGAIQAVLDAGGVLRVTGELGSGLGAAARHALALAREDRVEHAIVRCRARLGPAETVAALARELASVAGPVAPTLDAVRDTIAVLAGQDGRFLVVVEDLDLAPEGVEEVVARVAEAPGVAVVVTGRALPARPAGREIALRPLALAEVRTLLSAMFGTPTLPTGLDIALHHVTGGLPAMVVTILREQVARGAVWCEGRGEDGRPRWAWDATAPLSPGEGTTRLFDRALRALPEGARAIVQALAVAGEPVPLDLLLAAAGADASGEDLGPAVRHGVVVVRLVDGEEWVSIRRAVLEPILLAGLDEAREREIHLLLADAAGARPSGEWEQRFLVLHLALGAREPEDTARVVELGDWLVAGGRPVEALAVLDVAIRLPVDEGETLARLALARCDALVHLGRLPEARRAMEAGRAVAAAADDPALEARAALAHVDLALALGARLPEDARALVADPPPEAGARRFLAAANVRFAAGALDDAARLYDLAKERAPPGPVDRVAVAARLGEARVVALRGDLLRADTLYRGLVAELRAVDRVLATCEALTRLAEVQCATGRVAAAIESLRAAQELAAARGLPWALAAVAVGRARAHLAVGDVEGAGAILAAHAACGDHVAPWPVRREYLALAAELREAEGDTPAALAAHVRAIEAAAATPDVAAHAFHSGMVGILTADSAAVGAAVDALDRVGVPGLQARLLLQGGIVGRAAEIVEAAEAEARAAGDRLLLLRILHTRRDRAGGEARALRAQVLDGLFGALRERFLESPAARWALGERAGPRRDTGG